MTLKFLELIKKVFKFPEKETEFNYYIWFYEDERLAQELIECIDEYKLTKD